VDAGGVATPNLEPIERRERLLRGEVSAECSGARSGPGERFDLAGGAQPITADRPDGVLQRDQLGVRPLEAVGVETGGVLVELALALVEPGGELIEAGDERGDEVDLTGQREPSQPYLNIAAGDDP
jgi:hypothetical protein